MSNMVMKAVDFAVLHHADQKYGNFPYIVHLCDVVKNLRRYHYDDDEMICAGFLHDIIEDCYLSEDFLEYNFTKKVAQLVGAVTGVGTTRKERKADMIAKLKEYPKAIPLKMADRLANISNCVDFNPRLLEMYKKEFEDYDLLFESANSEMNAEIRKLIRS